MATIINLTCEFCNNKFSIKKGREKKFCSSECKALSRKENDSIFYIEKKCEYCDKIFTSKKKEKKKFCSYKCSGLHKKIQSSEIRKCVLCEKEFQERKKYKRKLCSEKCRIEWQKKSENIQLRIDKSKEAIFEKYGVNNLFQVNSIKEKALINLKKTYKERGGEILKNNLLKLEEKRREELIKRFNEIGYEILKFNNSIIKVRHPDGHIFEENRKLLVNRLNHNVELSTIIQPINSPRTTFEYRLSNFLNENNINHISNDRSTIKGELDIFMPEHKLAIEVNGLYWHCEYYLNNDYHLIKQKKCEEKNINLLQFFEDELLEKYDIILSIIKSKLGIINNKIFARKCVIKEIEHKISSKFLNENHLQGNVNASVKLGLFYENELVSLMTFGKMRNVLGNRSQIEGEYEMLRFCNKLNTTVIGGASKLLSYFIENYNPNKIVSFANKRYSDGNLYKKLGFDLQHETPPNYWYLLNKKRKHRFLFRKDVLVKEGFDKNKTEHQIMLERKIPRIYDCGNLKYALTI